MTETPFRHSSTVQDETVRKPARASLPAALATLAPLLGAGAGLLLGALPIWLAGANPLAAYSVMLVGAFGGARQITETVLRSVPLLLMGLGLTVAFRSRVWNIGGEGQYFIGALAGTVVGLLLQNRLPGLFLIPLMLLAGLVGGALWAGVATLLRLRFGINEIIATLMLNYIAEYSVLYLARVPLRDPSSFLPQSVQLTHAARMPTLVGTRLHTGILIALLLIPVVYLLLWKTPLGFRLRAVGANPMVAYHAGINVSRTLAFALLFSGALAGLTGIIEVSALHTRLKDGIGGGYGFSGILVALLGRQHPVGVLVAAIFFAALTIGAQTMHSVYGLPIALAQVIQGLVVLLVLVTDAVARRYQR